MKEKVNNQVLFDAVSLAWPPSPSPAQPVMVARARSETLNCERCAERGDNRCG